MQPEDGTEQGRFATAITTDNCHMFAWCDLDTDFIDDTCRPKATNEIADCEWCGMCH
jgi:hypothetical protein